jgi:trehalose 6-phosphate phosphatase
MNDVASPSRTLPERIASADDSQEPRLRAGSNWALFLDVDGTLLELTNSPEPVHADAALRTTIGHLAVALGGALALVSGRPLSDIDHIFAPLTLPAAGAHGLERRDARGCTERPAGAVNLDALRAPLRVFTDHHPGTLLEDKGDALALHYRQAPHARQAAEELLRQLIDDHPDHLKFLTGKMIFEIKPAHVDKGSAVAAFMREAPFAGRVPVFVGDDVTDEDGFACANRLGGHAVYVGKSKLTQAAYRLANIGAVHAWLNELVVALRG